MNCLPPTLFVYKPGSWVIVGDGIPAVVRQVNLTCEGVSYEVVWWDVRERKTAWLASFEVKPHEEALAEPIGFLTH